MQVVKMPNNSMTELPWEGYPSINWSANSFTVYTVPQMVNRKNSLAVQSAHCIQPAPPKRTVSKSKSATPWMLACVKETQETQTSFWMIPLSLGVVLQSTPWFQTSGINKSWIHFNSPHCCPFNPKTVTGFSIFCPWFMLLYIPLMPFSRSDHKAASSLKLNWHN